MTVAITILRDRLLSADPGFGRLLLAARVTLAVALSVLALAIGAAVYDVAFTVAILGAIVAMQASLAITDADARTTTLLAPVPGTIGITLGAVFASRGWLADIVFLAVLFGAVAIRARGPRWTAFGTIAMMTYFFALFLDATISQLPALIGAVFVALAITFCVRFILLPDRPAWLARRTMDAFKARLRHVSAAAKDLVRTRDPAPARHRLAAAIGRLNETAASIEGRLGEGAVSEVRLIFDAELAAEDVATEAQALRDAAGHVPRALALALSALVGGRAARAARVAARVEHDGTAHPAARALAAAVAELGIALVRVDAATATLALSEAPWSGGSGAQQPALRQAIQVTAASAAAIVIGEALSPQRWYWAVLAAYFVFVGTASSGETFARAWVAHRRHGAGRGRRRARRTPGARPPLAGHQRALRLSVLGDVHVAHLAHDDDLLLYGDAGDALYLARAFQRRIAGHSADRNGDRRDLRGRRRDVYFADADARRCARQRERSARSSAAARPRKHRSLARDRS